MQDQTATARAFRALHDRSGAFVIPDPRDAVNVIMGLGGTLSLAELADLGVKRVSVGSSLARAAYGECVRAAEQIRGSGTFACAATAVPYADMNRKMQG